MHSGQKQAELIRQLAEKLVEGSSLFVLDVFVSPGKTARIRVILDGDNGITIDDCAKLSRELNQQMVGSDFPENYNLEVTTPGVDASLKMPRQFPKHIGRTLKLVLKNEGLTVTGQLVEVDGGGIKILKEVPKSNKKQEASAVYYRFDELNKTIVQVSFK